MSDLEHRIGSVCVYCGSSDAASPAYLAAAAGFGRLLAAEEIRLVYGGGGVGLMGACARAAHAAGGRVLGIMPDFLRKREALLEEIDTVVVESMHERKMMMFEESDAFAVFPGGIGTLEEVIELLSWRRLELHRKPIVFFDPDGFWEPLFVLLRQFVAAKLAPQPFLDVWRTVNRIEDVLPAMRELAQDSSPPLPSLMPKVG
ncbi:MAG TPA: TIGR00730 family Rossman fold protein [Caulobacteraceae bacterium]|jgi:hypothetical protein